MSVASKVVIITGASSGIGASAAAHLASIGYKNIALVARRKDRLEEVAAKCKASGATNVLVLVKDLFLPNDCKTTIDDTVAHYGKLDILMSNAGMVCMSPTRHLLLEDFNKMMTLNFTANFLLTQHSLPHLEKTKGAILFVSSIADTIKSDFVSIYCASKAALSQFAQCVAGEEAKKGIRINLLCPGVVVTDLNMVDMLDTGNTREEKEASAAKRMAKYQPLGRTASVGEMAKLIAFLISDDNTFMVGARIVSDGGSLVKSHIDVAAAFDN